MYRRGFLCFRNNNYRILRYVLDKDKCTTYSLRRISVGNINIDHYKSHANTIFFSVVKIYNAIADAAQFMIRAYLFKH